MSDIWNILYSYEEAESALKSKDYLRAAEQFWWCDNYYNHGEFPYSQELENKATEAYKKCFGIIKAQLKTPLLSKSSYVMGCQCVKQMWLHKYKYNEREISAETQQAFDRGHIIGALAQRLFPNGIDVSTDVALESQRSRLQAKSPIKVDELPFAIKQYKWLKNTTLAIEDKEEIIYEAAFTHNNVFAALDILVCQNGEYVAYEVKSTPEIKEVYYTDCALQYYVINANVPIKEFYLVHINDSYFKSLGCELKDLTIDNCDIKKLFIKTSILDRILTMQDYVEANVKRFSTILKAKHSPNVSIKSERCDKPYQCSFKKYCQST